MSHTVRKAAVLGHPIAHSLSPTLHNAAYAALELAGWEYGRHDVTEDQLPEFLASLDAEWAGLSLTMPLKQAVIPLLDHVEPLAAVTGAVNTIVFSGQGSGRVTVGTNTDVHGIVAALKEGTTADGPLVRIERAAILGAGATAASALAALAELGCTQATVYVRSLGRTAGLRAAAQRMGLVPRFVQIDHAAGELHAYDAVISTLPPHGADPLAEQITAQAFTPRGVLLDVAYDPAPTALIAAWRNSAGSVEHAVTGERMLLHQAAEQVRLMTGKPGPLDAMSSSLQEKLAN